VLVRSTADRIVGQLQHRKLDRVELVVVPAARVIPGGWRIEGGPSRTGSRGLAREHLPHDQAPDARPRAPGAASAEPVTEIVVDLGTTLRLSSERAKREQ
jgi:hypothetical protein